MDPMLLVALVVLVVGVGVGLELTRRRRAADGQSRRPAAASPILDAETQERDGTTIAAVPEPEPEPEPWHTQAVRSPIVRVGVLTLLVLVVSIIGYATYNNLTARSPERFVLLVAPFDDGGDGQTGRNVADALARLVEQQAGGSVNVTVLDNRPASAQEALTLASQERGDLLIWGSVEPGAMLDSPALRPSLIYTPNGPYAPNSWDGYQGRFAMPRSFTLAREPINGQAVLAPLLVALADYANGEGDAAYEQLGRLLADYPALNAPLPRALRGNVLWARGFYGEAANEYRIATGEPADEPALLANNLGAILLDAGDPGALNAFAEAVRLLQGGDLGELRFNLGVLALREGRSLDAVVELEQARNLLPATPPLLLALAEGYRDSGRLDVAATALDDAQSGTSAASRLVPGTYRSLFNQRSEAALREQQALLALAGQLGAQGPLLWELDSNGPQPQNSISTAREQLRLAVDTNQLAIEQWRRRAAVESASNPGAGMLATGQAERAELSADRQQLWLAIVDTELSRSSRARVGSGLGSIIAGLFGGGGRGNNLANLEALRERDPENPTIVLTIARAQRIAGELDAADTSYDQAIALAPQRPEGYYGKALVATARGDRQRSTQLLGQAVERNGAFFPARIELARFAEETGDWTGAIAQRRALLQVRPGASSAVALAQALRRSGSANWAEAEQLLRPLSSSNAEAAIELARLYNDAGRPDSAVTAYNDALRVDTRSSTAAFELGQTLARQGDLEGAERSLRAALQYDEDNIDARLELADLYQGPLEQPDRADREYSAALAQGVRQVDRLVSIGDAALANENANQAIKAYEAALNQQPDNPAVLYKLGQAYEAVNRLETAASTQTRVLDLTTDLANPEQRALRIAALVSLGDIARQREGPVQSTDYYNQALQLDPNQIEAQLGLGQVAVGQGNWGVALGYFEAIAALPNGANNPLAQFWLAEGLLRTNNFQRATTAYNRALELQPEFPEAYLGLAEVQYAQGNSAAALETVNVGLGQRRDYAEGLLFRGKLLQELNQPDEALTSYDSAIRANDRIAESFYRRGVLHLSRSEYNAATSDLQRAVQLQANFPEASYWLGRSFYAQGRAESALSNFQRAIELNGNYVEALFYSGLAAEDLGRLPEAISAYQTVIQLDGASDLAARARVQLSRLT